LETKAYLYAYDARGNLHTKTHKESTATTVYTFNLFNQLIAVRSYQANLQEILLESWEYGYDALNRRIFKSYTNHYTKTDPAYKESFSHHYLYHHQAIIAILDEEQNILATLTHADTIDTPLSITNELTAQTYYYHTNHQGSITHLTNENAQIVESFTYDNSYGTITAHEQTEETYNPYCYTGREFDSDELYYYRARYYDPTVGRFISQDPIEFLSRDFNWYRYVGNEPVNRVDPSGLFDPVADAILAPVPTWDQEASDEAFETVTMILGGVGIAAHLVKKGLESLLKGGGVVVVKSNWAFQSGILRDTLKKKGNFGMGKATSQESDELGKSWVGNNARVASDGKTLVSEDGLRTYRPPSTKNSPYATTGRQANFEHFTVNAKGQKIKVGNGHLNIKD